MVVTELVLVSYNTDPKLQAELKKKAPEIFTHFAGVEGLQSLSRGRITSDNGTSLDPGSGRSALVLEWEKSSSFHNFFPNSPSFQSFVGLVKPFVASSISPELFESPSPSAQCTSANITQIIKVTKSNDTEEIWNKIKEAISQSIAEPPSFFHGSGIEEQQGNFLGMIGWQSQKIYEKAMKEPSVTKLMDKLTFGGKLFDIAADLTSIEISR